jgi:hypothetical protein
MLSHGGAVAEALPYLGSIFPVAMLQSTRPGPATHRPAALMLSAGRREPIGRMGHGTVDVALADQHRTASPSRAIADSRESESRGAHAQGKPGDATRAARPRECLPVGVLGGEVVRLGDRPVLPCTHQHGGELRAASHDVSAPRAEEEEER